ncbi:DNA polymerase sigma [Trypanosoma conorhini]|uniref:DNA polymerase sigma n=1 Tax=Trypanosoma conorhini TaxID=83891 RepID=A0A422NBY0_9TRYP|nr:DNA polymerase sigma [Trypanosoma conorhini]RNF03010.1 DNA polymerase sigma [Trypanosoma conorhini]
MKRRARVVSHASVVADDEPPTRGDAKAAINGANNKTPLDDAAKTPYIPPPAASCSLFSCFQQRRSDFSGEWLMMEEEAALPLVPPISPALTQKLREHQDTRQRQRSGADGGSGGKETAQATTAPTTKSKAKSAASAADGEGDAGGAGGGGRTPQGAEAEKPAGNGADDEGIRGDYLSLLPASGAPADVARSDLQATLTLREGRDGLVVPAAASAQSSRPGLRPAALSQQRVVPLWSVERYTARGGYASNAAIALHQEICDFLNYLRPSEAEVSMREIIGMEVRAIAKRLWPGCEPIVFGSVFTGLLLPLSDLDMTILNVPVSTEEALRALAREISRAELCHAAYPQLILKTKVPLVKFQHRHSLLDVDISINAEDGQRNSAIVADMLRSFPEARPLTVLVKYFLQQRGMHEPYHGGLGSFATTLLVISFLQHHPIYTERPEERAYTGLGRLLVDFFRYYGMYFNYSHCGISLLDGGRYFRRSDTSGVASSSLPGQRPSLGPTQVMIEDPGCTQNNAASSLRNFHVITSVFTHAYMALTAVFDAPAGAAADFSPDSTEIARRPTLLSRILHVDAPSVARRQSIAAAYEALTQDPAQKEKLLAAVAAGSKEEVLALQKFRLREGTSLRGSTKTWGQKRSRSGSTGCSSSSSSSRGSVTSTSSASSNGSSVRVVSRRLRR